MKLAVAVDLEEGRSEGIVDQAAAWVSRFGGTLDVIHAVRTPIVPPALARGNPDVQRVLAAEMDQIRRRESTRLLELLARIPEPCRGVVRLLEGPPIDALVDASGGYSGLFVATHGRSGLTHFWLGSVAEDVVRRARCTVIVLRLAQTRERGGEG